MKSKFHNDTNNLARTVKCRKNSSSRRRTCTHIIIKAVKKKIQSYNHVITYDKNIKNVCTFFKFA